MLKTAALALAVLVTASIGADTALAGGKVRHPPIRLGNVDRGGAKVKVFRLTKLDKKQKAPKTSGPDRIPQK
jgi:hypothetical protein